MTSFVLYLQYKLLRPVGIHWQKSDSNSNPKGSKMTKYIQKPKVFGFGTFYQDFVLFAKK